MLALTKSWALIKASDTTWEKRCDFRKSILGVDMMVPPLNSAEMDITMLMAKVDMVFSRLDTNKAQLRFERHMRVQKLFLNMYVG